MYHPFSVLETIRNAWLVLKKNFATVAVYSLFAFLIVVLSFFTVDFLLGDLILASIGAFILLLGTSFIFLGFIKMVFQLIDKEYYDFEFRDIVPKFKMLISYIILLVIVSTLAVIMTNTIKKLEEGMLQSLLGIFVGIFFEFFFLFYFPICTCFIVDDDSGPFESIAQSFQLIKGNFLKYFLLFLFIESLILLGSITVVGLIFAIPFVNIVLVVAYRKLVYSHQDVDDDITETL